MEVEFQSQLLELAALDDLPEFISQVEDQGCDVNAIGIWYGRAFGSKKMAAENRSPILIASLYGSTQVLNYIIQTGKVDVNQSCGSDRATPLHCAAAGGSWSSVDVVKLLIDASADTAAVDANGNRPADVIAPSVKFGSISKRKALEKMLKLNLEDIGTRTLKEYPVDTSLPDINTGMYGTDEFRMFAFKVTPCCRAYSHDWTECPFVHPGENARRRDPRKYPYTCVPCPDFKKGSCGKGNACEYAHGVFESWLHPAQYRTRLCKDETGCSRKVCFFAHKPEELRPVYSSTGSGVPSPKGVATNSWDSTMMTPLSIASGSLALPMSPGSCIDSNFCSPPMGGNMWPSRSQLKKSMRDVDLDMASLGLDEIASLRAKNLDNVFGSLDPSVIAQVNGLSPKASNVARQIMNLNQNQLRASYPKNVPSSPSRMASGEYGFESSAAAIVVSRSAAFSRRSHSFVERNGKSPVGQVPMKLSEWGSPDGKLDWGLTGDEVNKLRKSASFGVRSDMNAGPPSPLVIPVEDGPVGGGTAAARRWVDQMYIEQEKIVA